MGYIRLGNCPAGLGNWHRRVRASINRRNSTAKYDVMFLIRRCHERDYTQKLCCCNVNISKHVLIITLDRRHNVNQGHLISKPYGQRKNFHKKIQKVVCCYYINHDYANNFDGERTMDSKILAVPSFQILPLIVCN